MIPITIQLKNFLSYGEPIQTISFNNYQLICLSGKNGHGKSALLDAITWALWGQARKTNNSVKPDAHLLRLGQTHMVVILDFIVSHTHYRIRREYAHNHSKGYSVLEFGIIPHDNTTPIPLTDKTIKATQTVIEKTIGIDFDSFINSAFLRQGNANEFSKRSPKDRKEILASILGLDHYEKIRRRALEKVRIATTERQLLISLQEQLHKKIQQKNPIQQERIAITNTINALFKQKKTYEEMYALLENTLATINTQKQERSLLLFKKEELLKTQCNEENNLRKLLALYRTTQTILLPSTSKDLLIQDYDNLQKKLVATEIHITTLHALKESMATTSNTIQYIEQQTIHTNQCAIHEHEIALQQILNKKELLIQHATQLHKKLTSQHTDLTIYKEQQLLLNSLINAPDTTIAHTTLEKKYTKYITYVHTYQEKLRTLDDQKTRLTMRINDIQTDITAACPVCTQPLNDAQVATIAHNLASQHDHIIHQHTRLTKLITILPAHIKKIEAELLSYRTYKEKCNAATIKNNDLSISIQKITSENVILQKSIDKLNEELNFLENILLLQQTQLDNLKKCTLPELLNSNNEYHEVVQKLQKLNDQYNTIPYNNNEYILQKEQLAIIDKQIRAYHAYETTILKRIQYKEQIHTLCTILKTIKKSIHTLEDALIPTTSCDELYNATIEKKQHILEALHTTTKEYQEALTKQMRLDVEWEHISLIESEISSHSKLSSSLAEMASDYQIIATALSKDGIQALLIEEAIPEIEHETNILLAKLTNNQSHIIIDSLRDLKNGTVKETLDIKISDAAGIRPYELFSGGEAFRIDFALRIALSKLVAKRAGTTLQTLIIDEGFGSQDEEGLGHIMDAIYTIQNDFDKIIIVSHLPILKEQFPVHFIVQKGSLGSTVEVIEQG